MNEIKLHDIKALEIIPDYSLFILIALLFIVLFIIVSAIYFSIQFFKNRHSQKKLAINTLSELDLNDAKASAYTITQLGKILISNEREQKLYEELVEDLEQYKYKKEVAPFNELTHQHFKQFMDAIDAR